MTTLALAAMVSATLAHAHEPAAQTAEPPTPISATAVLTGPLPREITHEGDTWLLDGHRLVGTDEARSAAMMTVLAQAPGNDVRVDRARRRDRQALTLALGGLGFESAGLAVAVAAAVGVVGVAAGPALALPIGLAGAGVGLTGCVIGITNPPLRRAVKQYNVWAETHPDALDRPVDAHAVEAAQAWAGEIPAAPDPAPPPRPDGEITP